MFHYVQSFNLYKSKKNYFIAGGAGGAGSGVKNITSVSLASTIHPRDPTGPRWWMRGSMSKKISEDIIRLLKVPRLTLNKLHDFRLKIIEELSYVP